MRYFLRTLVNSSAPDGPLYTTSSQERFEFWFRAATDPVFITQNKADNKMPCGPSTCIITGFYPATMYDFNLVQCFKPTSTTICSPLSPTFSQWAQPLREFQILFKNNDLKYVNICYCHAVAPKEPRLKSRSSDRLIFVFEKMAGYGDLNYFLNSKQTGRLKCNDETLECEAANLSPASAHFFLLDACIPNISTFVCGTSHTFEGWTAPKRKQYQN